MKIKAPLWDFIQYWRYSVSVLTLNISPKIRYLCVYACAHVCVFNSKWTKGFYSEPQSSFFICFISKQGLIKFLSCPDWAQSCNSLASAFQECCNNWWAPRAWMRSFLRAWMKMTFEIRPKLSWACKFIYSQVLPSLEKSQEWPGQNLGIQGLLHVISFSISLWEK